MDIALLPSDEYKIKKFCTELIDGKYFCYYNNKTKEEYKDICNFFDRSKIHNPNWNRHKNRNNTLN